MNTLCCRKTPATTHGLVTQSEVNLTIDTAALGIFGAAKQASKSKTEVGRGYNPRSIPLPRKISARVLPRAAAGRNSLGLSAPPLGSRRCSRENPPLPGLRSSHRGFPSHLDRGISVEPPWSHRRLLLRCPGRLGPVAFGVDARRLRRHCCDVRRDWCFRSRSRPRVVLPLAVAVAGDRWWGVKPGE